MLFALFVLGCVVFCLRNFSPEIYDFVILRMTARWYESVLGALPSKSTLLDVGVGTASALAAHASTVASKDLRVTGVDYDMKYVAAARRRCEGDARLAKRVHVRCLSIYDDQLLATLRPAGGFDASYFSGSLSLMPDPAMALRAAAAVTKPGGYVYVTQTFQRRPVPLLRFVKPLLKYATTIDFGQLTTERDAEAIFAASGLAVLEHEPIAGSVDTRFQRAYRTVLRAPS